MEKNFFPAVRFFRVVPNFVVQWGIHGDVDTQAQWRDATIKDEPTVESNKKGYVTFAKSGPDTRTTQMFINYKDNANLDAMGFPPFAKVRWSRHGVTRRSCRTNLNSRDRLVQVRPLYGAAPLTHCDLNGWGGYGW